MDGGSVGRRRGNGVMEENGVMEYWSGGRRRGNGAVE
jgi:hypothetical protein